MKCVKVSQDFVMKSSHFIILIDFKSFASRYYGRLVLTSEMTTKPVLRDELALTKITVEGLLVSWMREINVIKERPLFFHPFQAIAATMMDVTHVSVPKVIRGELLLAEVTEVTWVLNVLREHLLRLDPLVTFIATKMTFSQFFLWRLLLVTLLHCCAVESKAFAGSPSTPWTWSCRGCSWERTNWELRQEQWERGSIMRRVLD